MVDMEKATFTLAEAAKLLSCHPETLRRAIKDQSLRAARLGRGFRISKLDLQTFWIERGGGDLFEKTEAEDPETKEKEPGAQKNAPQKPLEPQQLTLPT